MTIFPSASLLLADRCGYWYYEYDVCLVKERTREIGIRMSIGARQGNIRNQFLIEALVVCLIVGARLATWFAHWLGDRLRERVTVCCDADDTPVTFCHLKLSCSYLWSLSGYTGVPP